MSLAKNIPWKKKLKCPLRKISRQKKNLAKNVPFKKCPLQKMSLTKIVPCKKPMKKNFLLPKSFLPKNIPVKKCPLTKKVSYYYQIKKWFLAKRCFSQGIFSNRPFFPKAPTSKTDKKQILSAADKVCSDFHKRISRESHEIVSRSQQAGKLVQNEPARRRNSAVEQKDQAFDLAERTKWLEVVSFYKKRRQVFTKADKEQEKKQSPNNHSYRNFF